MGIGPTFELLSSRLKIGLSRGEGQQGLPYQRKLIRDEGKVAKEGHQTPAASKTFLTGTILSYMGSYMGYEPCLLCRGLAGQSSFLDPSPLQRGDMCSPRAFRSVTATLQRGEIQTRVYSKSYTSFRTPPPLQILIKGFLAEDRVLFN